MKKIVISSWLLLSILMLAACQSDTVDSQSNGESNENGENNDVIERNDEKTTSFTDDLGNEVDIPVQPERVITTQYTEIMLAVDFPPVGAATHTLDAGYLSGMVDGIEDVGEAMQVDLEKIVELEPDLIIAHQFSADFYDQLNDIAPTILIDTHKRDLKEQITYIAEILGKGEKGDAWITSYNQVVEEAKATLDEHMEEHETVGLYMPSEKDALRFFTGNVSYALYNSLEFQPPEKVQEEMKKDSDLEALPVSFEVLDQYDADYMFLMVMDSENMDEVDSAALNSPIWETIPAFKNDQIYTVDADVWFRAEPLSLELKIQEIVDFIVGEEN